MKYLLALLCAVQSFNVAADLKSMSDDELSDTTGEGLGFALEDFAFTTKDAVTTFTGLENSQNEEITAQWTDYYIYGEGSNYGSQLVTTDIGSYRHPWVFRSVRGGGEGLERFGNDIALLEFKTDSYSAPLQDSTSFILHNLYQGCIWGYKGCGEDGSPFDAVNAISAQIDSYQNEYTDLIGLYSGSYVGGVSSQLLSEAESVQSPGGAIYEQQLVIGVRQVELAEAIRDFEQTNPGVYAEAQRVAGEEYQETLELYELTDKSVELGDDYSCGGFLQRDCTPAEDAYNDQLDIWVTAENELGDIQNNWKEETMALANANADLSDILIGEDSKDESGRTLAERIADADRFQVLCGDSANDDACTNGIITKRDGERGVVNDIAVAISGGQYRRQGMDIGSRFRFEVVNENKNTGEITRVEDFLSFELRGVYTDGMYFRLWSRPDPETQKSELRGELGLRFFAKEYAISACGLECEIQAG
ncbi:MAG: hypothetical protein VW274_00185, partial [Thalassolituus sp.]